MALSKYKRDEHDLFNEIMGFSPSNKTETPSAVVSDSAALEIWDRIKNKSDSMPTYDKRTRMRWMPLTVMKALISAIRLRLTIL